MRCRGVSLKGERVQSVRRNDHVFDEPMGTGQVDLGSATPMRDLGCDVDERLTEPLPFPADGFG